MFEDITYDILLQRMLDRVPNKLDKRAGSVIWDTHSPTAIEFRLLYMALDTVVQEAYGDTASRQFLIQRCKERGITPFESTNAVLKGEFTPTGIDVTGKRFNIGQINYTVIEKVSDGVYRVQCETKGTIGNRYLGRMLPIEYISGLATAELTEVLIPGEDEEETEDLRQRYFESFDRKAFGGNVKDYLEKTNAIPGVGCTKVTRVWNGDIRPADMLPSTAVASWYQSIQGTLAEPVKQWLDDIYRAAAEKKLTTGGTVKLTILNSEYDLASNDLVETVQEIIDPEENAGEGYGLAPIGHMVTVQSAVGVTISVDTDITYDPGYTWAGLQTDIENAVKGYFQELRKEWAGSRGLVIRVSQVETRILGLKGVVDIGNTKINGQAGNFSLGPYDVPVFGGVSA